MDEIVDLVESLDFADILQYLIYWVIIYIVYRLFKLGFNFISARWDPTVSLGDKRDELKRSKIPRKTDSTDTHDDEEEADEWASLITIDEDESRSNSEGKMLT